ncbi:ABC transporter permease [Staphylococcus capitis]|uniref:ABC transporter permease n=1 Tax=Staphylococcus capitis TaxID=29388 RepID=A0A7Z8E3T4_STACP|nr:MULTISPECIES: ABC transporter permease [Staphylococcus]MBC3079458.1 ABC transporter permease [Staphylococcus capitis]MBE7321963.1 ABC transporter permease [Staphylococcus capitis]MBU5290888.1 ABC transporter permease [Staphylococcus capitis]MCC3689846.1 ABC transporter permease [Staphylococcus capitis]MCC9111078.1 ABC transporter permease [Staphylococcus capitis]
MFKFNFLYISKIRATWLLYLIGLYPLLIFLAELLNSNFLSLSATQTNSVSFLELFIAIYDTQQKAMISLIIVGYLASLLFYSEISTGRLLFYKDQSRYKIFNSKLTSIISSYFIFLSILLLSTLVVYLFYVNNHQYSSHSFMLNNYKLNQTLILNLLGIFLTDLFLIFYVVIFSVKFNSGITIISMILCYVVIKLTDNINKIKFFPSNFTNLNTDKDFIFSLLAMSTITVVYIIIFYVLAITIFRKIQF